MPAPTLTTSASTPACGCRPRVGRKHVVVRGPLFEWRCMTSERDRGVERRPHQAARRSRFDPVGQPRWRRLLFRDIPDALGTISRGSEQLGDRVDRRVEASAGRIAIELLHITGRRERRVSRKRPADRAGNRGEFAVHDGPAGRGLRGENGREQQESGAADRRTTRALTGGASGERAGAEAPAAIQEFVEPAAGDEGVHRQRRWRRRRGPTVRHVWVRRRTPPG